MLQEEPEIRALEASRRHSTTSRFRPEVAAIQEPAGA
jgi:hypothetical protein